MLFSKRTTVTVALLLATLTVNATAKDKKKNLQLEVQVFSPRGVRICIQEFDDDAFSTQKVTVKGDVLSGNNGWRSAEELKEIDAKQNVNGIWTSEDSEAIMGKGYVLDFEISAQRNDASGLLRMVETINGKYVVKRIHHGAMSDYTCSGTTGTRQKRHLHFEHPPVHHHRSCHQYPNPWGYHPHHIHPLNPHWGGGHHIEDPWMHKPSTFPVFTPTPTWLSTIPGIPVNTPEFEPPSTPDLPNFEEEETETDLYLPAQPIEPDLSNFNNSEGVTVSSKNNFPEKVETSNVATSSTTSATTTTTQAMIDIRFDEKNNQTVIR